MKSREFQNEHHISFFPGLESIERRLKRTRDSAAPFSASRRRRRDTKKSEREKDTTKKENRKNSVTWRRPPGILLRLDLKKGRCSTHHLFFLLLSERSSLRSITSDSPALITKIFLFLGIQTDCFSFFALILLSQVISTLFSLLQQGWV